MVPVVDHTMSDRIMHTVSRRLRIRKRLVANEEIQIFDAALRGEVPRFGRDRGSSAGRLGGGPAARRDCRWKDTMDNVKQDWTWTRGGLQGRIRVARKAG